ncbi:hypothetical protein C8Q70DRAFT_1011426 [Cubamyces menziesii]|nr:hypothetical protein C8Q70DRAFT_1011426 [Cubamyces menziesii]
MSISTSSCRKPAGLSSDAKHDSQAVVTGWASELSGRILPYGSNTDDFIDALLPCSTPYRPMSDLSAAFTAYKPAPGKEIREYPHLCRGLKAIVEPFPSSIKPEFAVTHLTKLSFPFDAFVKHHHQTSPDISVSFPGKSIRPIDWQSIAMVIEVKAEEKDDPFPRRGLKNVRTVEQLAKNARNLMLAHGFLAAYVVGIYGNSVRIARFDHTCALVSKAFNLKVGGAKTLQKFFWHFAHPMVGNTVVGADPTVTPLDAGSQEWVKSELRKANARNWPRHMSELRKGRRVEVYDEKTGRCVPYLLYHVVDVNGRLFSRATMVWRAIEDTRIWRDGRLVANPACTTVAKPRILKEAWRQLIRTAEAQFYHRLNEKIPEERRYGLPKMVCGGDIGVFEYRWWKDSQKCSPRRKRGRRISGPPGRVHSAVPSPLLFSSMGSSTSPPAAGVSLSSDYIPQEGFPLPHPLHQTYSWRLVYGNEYVHRERSHMRMVIDDVGRPLTEFVSTREMVRAMRDAIKGHELAWKDAKLLHRDVSVGNILIADNPEGNDFIGFIHDFDYSSMEDDGIPDECDGGPAKSASAIDLAQAYEIPEDLARKKEHTGTFYFMAIEILTEPGVIHDAHHDLESFYWVLIWVFVRHTNHGDYRGKGLCDAIFKFGSDESSADAKSGWLERARFNVPGNKPLTYLLEELTALVLYHIPTRRRDARRTLLTYESVLEVFDKALAMDGWPENDWRPCELFKTDGRTGIAPILATVPDEAAYSNDGSVFYKNPVQVLLTATGTRPPKPKVVLPPPPRTAPQLRGPMTRSRARAKRAIAAVMEEDEQDDCSSRSLLVTSVQPKGSKKPRRE